MRIIKRAIFWAVKKFRTWFGLVKVYHLSPTGDDEAGDGTREKPWATFKKILAELKPGDSIYLFPGVYHQTLPGSLTDDVTIRGSFETE